MWDNSPYAVDKQQQCAAAKGEFAERLDQSGKSYMAMLWFYCDESYESKNKIAKTYVVSGFITEKRVWERVEGLWQRVNKCRDVIRFHASHLNARDHEFAGWTPQRSKRYTKTLLKIITEPKEKAARSRHWDVR